MNRKNFFLISLSAPVLILPITSIACKSDQIYASTDISNINKEFSQYQNQIHELVSINNEKGNAIRQFIQKNPIIQITAAGKINDNSFNQMTWEAISIFSNLVGVNTSTYKETNTPSPAEMFQAYSDALNKNYKIWVLTGWTQEQFFAEWIKIPFYRQKFFDKKIKVISIDWDVNKYLCDINSDGTKTQWGTGISLNFKTQESSFLIGYAVSQFLAEQYPGEQNKDKRILNCSAGADASGSTNFNYGFVEGIRRWNDEQKTNDTKVSHNVYMNNQKVFLNTTYIDNNPLTRNDFFLSVKGNGDQIFKEQAPSIIMPVAGDWSRTAANIIKENNKKDQQWVVGVDSNMAISYGKAYSDYFITSSEKRIGIAIYKSLCFLSGISQELNISQLYPDSTNTILKINLDQNIIIDPSNSFTGTPTNMTINGGIDLGFVGASPSSISSLELANKFDAIVEATTKKFFGENGILKNVDPTLLKKFEEVKVSGNIEEYNQALFELNNVLYGEMSANNASYFNRMIDEINKWLI